MKRIRPVAHPRLGLKTADPEILLVAGQLIGYLVEYAFHFRGQCAGVLPDVGPVKFEDRALLPVDLGKIVRTHKLRNHLRHPPHYEILPIRLH